MALSNPISPLCIALLLAIPGIFLLGRAASRRSVADAALANILAPGLGLAIWLLCVHFAGLLSQSFVVGLSLGTALPAACGYALHLRSLRSQSGKAPDATPASTRMLVFAAVMAATLIPAAIGWCFHDEVAASGHLAIAAQFANDVYPPRNMTFPTFPLRYHYGFNVLSAALVAIFRLDASAAIDTITVISWSYIACLLWVLGDSLFGRGAGWLTALITMLGGRLPLECPEPMGGPSTAASWLGRCAVEGSWIAPPFVSNHFQHPWSVGIPLGLCALLISMQRPGAIKGFTAADRSTERYRLISLGLVLTALSLCQVIVFVCALCSIVAVELWSRRRELHTHALPVLLLAVVVLCLARQMGGFFLPTPDGEPLGIILSGGIAKSLLGAVRWNYESFGLLAILGVAGLLTLPRERLLIGLLATGSAATLNLFKYSRTWDIVKFGNILSLCLGIGASALMARALVYSAPRWVRALGSIATLGLISAGVLFIATFAADLPGIDPIGYPRSVEMPADADVAAIEWLRRHVKPGELVYRTAPEAIAYGLWGGLPEASFGWDGSRQYGFSDQRLFEREFLVSALPDEPGAFRAAGINWFVIDGKTPEPEALVSRWLQRGDAALRVEFPPLRLVEVIAAPSALEVRPAGQHH